MKPKSKKFILDFSKELITRIEHNREVLIKLLLDYESYETAKDEVYRSLDSLEYIEKEIDYLTKTRLGTMCTFFPVNLPLYSLVIFALIPSFMVDKVFVRPPQLMTKIVEDIIKILELETLFPNVIIVEMERGLFRDAYASVADVILFTGRYQNAMDLQSYCPDSLFIYNGAGVNPVVVTELADLELAAKKIVEMRTFNSGQDCAGSDAILVHKSVSEKFLKFLISDIKKIKVGDYHNRENIVGQIVKQDTLPELKSFFESQKDYLKLGGKIDLANGIVYPTLFVEEMKDITSIHYTEFFAPVFYVLVYDSDEDLKRYFLNQHYIDHAMYISLFGDSQLIRSLDSSVILLNEIVNDVERGFNPYGGYGGKANFIIYKNKKIVRPLLISKEISETNNVKVSPNSNLQII